MRDATKHQGAQALRARQDRVDQLPSQVTHRVVVCELQVGLPAQPLLGVLVLRRALSVKPRPRLRAVWDTKERKEFTARRR